MNAFMPAEKKILITGAAIRIGRVLALHFAEKGWQVAVHYNRSAEEARTLQAEGNGRIQLFQGDLTQAHAAEKLFEAVQCGMGGFGFLINNASLFERDDTTPQAKTLHYAVNVGAPVRLTELLAAQEIKDAAVIHMLDATLDVSREKLSAYAASKEELEHWTANAAPRLKPRLRLYGVKLGPVMRNPRESQAHFDRAALASKKGKPTPLPAIIEKLEILLADTSYSQSIIQDLS